MVNQVLYRTFKKQQGCEKALLPTGPKAWEAHDDILVEGLLLTCCNAGRGARYCTSFSPRFPHFEVMIVENEKNWCLTLGVVFQDYIKDDPPGFGRTVGLVTESHNIEAPGLHEAKTPGHSAYRRGDVIRVTVMFEDERERDGNVQVPVVFTVNGRGIIPPGDQTYIDYSPDRPLYPCVYFRSRSEGKSSVLAKMCVREDVDYEGLQLQEVKSELSEVKSELSEVKSKLEEVNKVNRSLTEKLDAVLARLGEKKVNK